MLLDAKLKHEIFRETALVASYSFIKISSHNAVKHGKIMVEHDLLTADQVNGASYTLNGNDGACFRFVHELTVLKEELSVKVVSSLAAP